MFLAFLFLHQHSDINSSPSLWFITPSLLSLLNSHFHPWASLKPPHKGKICSISFLNLKNKMTVEFAASKLNPSAEEFIPSARKPDRRLSADAPSFDYTKPSVKDSSIDGSSINQKGKKGFNQGRNSRVQKIRRTVYISDISQDVAEEVLVDMFKFCGEVKDHRICGDPHSFFRFAFIEFSKEIEAKAALTLAGTFLGFHPIRVLPSKTAIVPVNARFLPKSEDELEMVARTIYCTNIDKKVTQTHVKTFFEYYCGEVKRLRLLLDNKSSTCIAFVEFAQVLSANIAPTCSGTFLGSLPIRVSPSKTPVRAPVPRSISQ